MSKSPEQLEFPFLNQKNSCSRCKQIKPLVGDMYCLKCAVESGAYHQWIEEALYDKLKSKGYKFEQSVVEKYEKGKKGL